MSSTRPAPDQTDQTDQTGSADSANETDETDEVDEVNDAEEVDAAESTSNGRRNRRRHRAARRRLSRAGSALVTSGVILAVLAGLAGWLGYRAYEKHEAEVHRNLFIQVARQGAVNLTTVDFAEVDADVQRIMELSTGAFHDDFQQRAKSFIEVVKAAQSKSEGTITDAGLESQRGDSAQVLVAVAVKTRTAGGEESPREWRMRIEVQSVGESAKVSNVVFVP
jgi:Mce-associated membrane protein